MERELEFIRIDIDKLLYNYFILNGIECCLDELSYDDLRELTPKQRQEIAALNNLFDVFAEPDRYGR